MPARSAHGVASAAVVAALAFGLAACESRGIDETFNDLKMAAGGPPPEGAILASADADLPIILESNKDTTVYSIDGQQVGRGKHVKVWIADDRQHTIVALPDKCNPKEDVIHPPYRRDSRIGFYYLRQDCPGECFPGMPCPSQTPQPAPPVTNAPPKKKTSS